MPKGIVDYEGLRGAESQALRELRPRAGLPFRLTKIGHVVLMSTDLRRSVEFTLEDAVADAPPGQDTRRKPSG